MVFEGFDAPSNRSRVISGAVGGTVFLGGDDLTRSSGQSLARANLTNSAVNAVARLGRPFRPLDGNTGTNSATVHVLRDGGTTYVALFNFDGANAVTRRVSLVRAGLSGLATYRVTDLWEGRSWTASGTLIVDLPAGQAALLRLE
jgi:hypothetical protein